MNREKRTRDNHEQELPANENKVFKASPLRHLAPQQVRLLGEIMSKVGQEKQKKESSLLQKCLGCGVEFASRNAIFKHLRDTDGACLTGEEYDHFCKRVRCADKGVRVLILFGYMPLPGRVRNGDDAATFLLQAIQQWQKNVDRTLLSDNNLAIKYNRSYGNSQRTLEVIVQDENTGAVTEVLTTRLQPIRGNRTIDQWLDEIQEILNTMFASTSPCSVQILGRQDVPNATKFNAEMDVTHRRIEYLLPIEFITWNAPDFRCKLESLPPFEENHKSNLNHSHVSDAHKTDEETRRYLFQLKKIMQSLTTQVIDFDMTDKAAVMEKSFSLQKRKTSSKKLKKGKKAKKEEDAVPPEKQVDTAVVVTEQHRLLRRKRFHNFTPMLMAHEYLACRRMDRMYHRATLNFPSIDPEKKSFIVLSITGDIFLTGQACRVVGLFLALANHLIDQEIVDCIFDESYPHLIPTPPAPIYGMVAGEARYMAWEGKLKSILSARRTDRYPNGWNQQSTLERVKKWHDTIHEEIARHWLSKGRDERDGRLKAEKEWTEAVLLPWVEGAKRHLEEYRNWKKEHIDQESNAEPKAAPLESSKKEVNDSTPPLAALSLESVDASVPDVFRKVLYHLQKVDESGQWPSTTLKRQLVMVSTADSEEAKQQATTSLSMARLKARNNKESRSSAYGYTEGQGGASGSFSVGLMPGGKNKQPKSNFLFPELVQAAFELERVLCPDREPSSTIAINRNAQFRPHTDSGAGAGQSTSLIVALGTYSGGELMVEGDKHDIRYKAIEFNGWKQRHWTMPFVGERYSLVWFTPKGCEGLRGIDLDFSMVQPEIMVQSEEEVM